MALLFLHFVYYIIADDIMSVINVKALNDWRIL